MSYSDFISVSVCIIWIIHIKKICISCVLHRRDLMFFPQVSSVGTFHAVHPRSLPRLFHSGVSKMLLQDGGSNVLIPSSSSGVSLVFNFSSFIQCLMSEWRLFRRFQNYSLLIFLMSSVWFLFTSFRVLSTCLWIELSFDSCALPLKFTRVKMSFNCLSRSDFSFFTFLRVLITYIRVISNSSTFPAAAIRSGVSIIFIRHVYIH